MKIKSTWNKLVAVILIVFVVCSMNMLGGCYDDSPKFVTVAKVEFTTGGVTKTVRSTRRDIYTIEGITKEEYLAQESGRPFPGYAELDKESAIAWTFNLPEGAKTKIVYEDISKKSYSVYYYGGWYDYAKWTFKGTRYSMVQVKVINSTTLEIKDEKGVTTYTVSSYRITYFDCIPR